MAKYTHLKKIIDEGLSEGREQCRVVRDIDLFVLDNSLRESTVGQIVGHTLENKWAILEEVKKCGFKNIIISAFSHAPRVDDTFVQQLCERESDMSTYYAFSEIGEGHLRQEFPVGLKKMKQYGIQNPIFEIDLALCKDNATKFQILLDLFQKRFDYAYENLCANAKIFVNIRDLAPTMMTSPDTVFNVVEFLAKMPPEKRPLGIMFEEPTGDYVPLQLGAFSRSVRQFMDECDWKSAHLLVHIHKKWEYGEAAQLECLVSGADGIWCSVCEEGAALGHACSTVSIMNFIRAGNQKVLKKFNCTYLRQAAINVTKLTTGLPPHPRQTVYGERALDVVFDEESGMGIGGVPEMLFDLEKFFGVKAPTRMSTLASPAMIKDRLIQVFGKNDEFTEDIAVKMKAVMIDDLTNDRKEEYMSEAGLAILFDRAGGKLTDQMRSIVMAVEISANAHKNLIKKVRKIWDAWDLTEEESGDDCLEFYSFYSGFMAPYFGNYECEYLRKGLQVLDMNENGKIDWSEFCIYLKWALREYPNIGGKEELLAAAFQKGIIPAMKAKIK